LHRFQRDDDIAKVTLTAFQRSTETPFYSTVAKPLKVKRNEESRFGSTLAFGRSMRQDRRGRAEIDLEQTEEAWVYTLRRIIIEWTIADSCGNYRISARLGAYYWMSTCTVYKIHGFHRRSALFGVFRTHAASHFPPSHAGKGAVPRLGLTSALTGRRSAENTLNAGRH
jgi:hypothetical protein